MPSTVRHYPVVCPGDRVRLVSPASYPDRPWLDESVAILESWGLRAEIGEHAMSEWGYMAGTDDERAADLNDALRDPGVRAIVTTRGGAGAYHIAESIDIAAAAADPKPLVGFSDITYLHLSLLARAGLGGLHGCLAGPTATSTVRQLLMTTDPITLPRDDQAVSAAVGYPGCVEGPLIGGSLTGLATSVGVRVPDLAGAILFLESQRAVGLGTVDRQLTQLIRSGALDGIVGVVLGSFEGFRDYADRGWTITEVFEKNFEPLGVPLLGGVFAGHDLTTPDGLPDQCTVPLGAVAHLDAASGSVVVEPLAE